MGRSGHDGPVPRPGWDVRTQLDEDARLGYAYSQTGWVVRGSGVASPFFDPSGRCIGAITVRAPIDHMTPEAARLIGPEVRKAAAQLSRRLGHSGERTGLSASPALRRNNSS